MKTKTVKVIRNVNKNSRDYWKYKQNSKGYEKCKQLQKRLLEM